MERLQKHLAHSGVGSRRMCEALIADGRVKVNGRVVTEQGVKVDPQRDLVEVDGRPVREVEPIRVLLNKPRGYISTADDPRGRPTVLDLIPLKERLYPVGRLDRDSEGFVLLTNDGSLTERLLHPRYEHEREYWVFVEGNPSAEAISRLRMGVRLDEGLTGSAVVEVLGGRALRRYGWLGADPTHLREDTWLRLVIRQGWKRQIRRMCLAVGHPVRRLVRVRMGGLDLGDLAPGMWRHLGCRDVNRLLVLPQRPCRDLEQCSEE